MIGKIQALGLSFAIGTIVLIVSLTGNLPYLSTTHVITQIGISFMSGIIAMMVVGLVQTLKLEYSQPRGDR